MVTRTFVQYLERYWQGPALEITVAGKNYRLGQGTPQTTIIIHRPFAWRRAAPSLAFGEAYMRGDVEIIGNLLDILQGYYQTNAILAASRQAWVAKWWHHRRQEISTRRALGYARHHYDISNEFYRLWLDPLLVYSCAYFLGPEDSLAAAQQQKLELLCRKLRLEPGQSLLDIGCGWGALLFHAATRYNTRVTGITAAIEQARYIRAEIKRRDLQDQIQIIVGDWRKLTGKYDRVVSVGMFEHVGQAQYPLFFKRWRGLLHDHGLSLLHTIGRMQIGMPDSWIRKYIFPGGYLPTLAELAEHMGEQHLRIMDVENLRQHYALTLHAWSRNFQAVSDQVVRMYNEEFVRMWWLYLQGSEAAFRWGGLNLWQVVMTPKESTAWPLNREVETAHLG
ncbi:MAG: cyclopropane-fatty-acyl-phospholipid synthase family protein [Candidatus Andersenbacteria bacterium]